MGRKIRLGMAEGQKVWVRRIRGQEDLEGKREDENIRR